MEIKRIKVTDFLSIDKLEYNFIDGLHLFLGTNGAGKSSILTALQVGLYNKCNRPQPWARLAGAGGFTIEVDFIDINGKETKIINNRTKNTYEVYEDGLILTNKISRALPIVSQKLNLSYDEFSLLTFLTPSTVSNILTGTDSSLISKFFCLDILTLYDKKLREERTVLNRDKRALEAKLSESLESIKVYDVVSLENELKELEGSKLEILESFEYKTHIPSMEREVSNLYNSIERYKYDLITMENDKEALSNSTGECRLCGHSLDIDTLETLKALDNITSSINSITTNKNNAIAQFGLLNTKIQTLVEMYSARLGVLDSKIGDIKSKVIASQLLSSRESIDVDKVSSELATLELNTRILTLAIESIKTGEVHKAYLQTFAAVLNSKLAKLKANLNLSMRVIAKIGQNGLSFSIFDEGGYKAADILSAGEKVIIGLLVLDAMFETLEETLGINVSTVILDEAVGAVSTENMYVVESVLKSLASKRCVLVSQHHDELPEEIFDSVSIVTKTNGITELNKIKGD